MKYHLIYLFFHATKIIISIFMQLTEGIFGTIYSGQILKGVLKI